MHLKMHHMHTVGMHADTQANTHNNTHTHDWGGGGGGGDEGNRHFELSMEYTVLGMWRVPAPDSVSCRS